MLARVHKGDSVLVLSGKDKGETGLVLKVFPKLNKVLVRGVNMKLSRVRRDEVNQTQKERRLVEHPVFLSKVLPLHPDSKRGTRIRIHSNEDGSKVRVSASKKSGNSVQI